LATLGRNYTVFFSDDLVWRAWFFGWRCSSYYWHRFSGSSCENAAIFLLFVDLSFVLSFEYAKFAEECFLLGPFSHWRFCL